MHYGILGGANGSIPQITGKASWLVARTCFPDDGLNGGNGHTAADVTCKQYTTPFHIKMFPLTRLRHPLHWRRSRPT